MARPPLGEPQPAAAPVPALLARYRDLGALRYDYPLVLTAAAGDDPPLRPLSALVDEQIAQFPPGPEAGAERRRRQMLRIEEGIRRLAQGGVTGTLATLWRRVSHDLPPPRIDGEVVDCSAGTAAAVVAHLWRWREAARAAPLADRLQRLILQLRTLLRADFLESAGARAPEHLQRSLGAVNGSPFDFSALSRLLAAAPAGATLPPPRQRRILETLQVLEQQRFVALPGGDRARLHAFSFESGRAALEALGARLPAIAAVVRAMRIAELELDNRYREPLHDALFARFDASQLTARDLAPFPRMLVTERNPGPQARSELLDILASPLPVKILVQLDDLHDMPPLSGGDSAPQLARMALGLPHAFVLQAGLSHLYRMHQKIRRGLDADAPALFCVYTGCGAVTALPPYLVAAAAVESRAFPLFTYDPGAGDDLAARFDVRDNPQPEADWCRNMLEYEGPAHQRMRERLAFTYADFAACDARQSGRLARQPAASMEPGAPGVIALADGDGVLDPRAAGDELTEATRRCAAAWRGLQELGGIGNSHAARLLAQQRAARERETRQPEAVAPAAPTAAVASPAPPASAATGAAAAPPAPSGAAWIETPRCTTCEECVQINSRLFAYDANKQAYIADLRAGTYRDLVEAAESCQVSIIHPGTPHDPAEAGLEDLVRRAQPFM